VVGVRGGLDGMAGLGSWGETKVRDDDPFDVPKRTTLKRGGRARNDVIYEPRRPGEGNKTTRCAECR
jgi:hypothetical protein